ncbi:MAG: 50S ribosomal protein L9 [Candidatus Omnitrophica bacterium]|nr:50S ribosomal protein L9 [Candidatus Omnitrophota bacterium]
MDVVLVHAVDALGPAGAVVKVKPGFARNFLLPRGLAVAATPQQLKAIETSQRQRERKSARITEEAERVKRQIESRSLTLKLSLGEDQKPFGAITTHDIVDALAGEGIAVEKHAVHLEQPIKALGIFEVPVRVHADVTAIMKVWVVKA